MRIRGYRDTDLDILIELTIETFRPFFEQSFPAMVGLEVDLIEHQHGHWEQDYREQVPTLHDPGQGREVAVAVDDDDTILGYVAWLPDPSRPQHGQVEIIAVDTSHRRGQVGTRLMQHALDQMRAQGMRYVGLGTGGDRFHAPARGLYESLGFPPIPIVGYLRSL
jgi:ribosomal protein S18 acetylase RimI-like enzyme